MFLAVFGYTARGEIRSAYIIMEEQNIFDELCGCEMCHQAPADKTENPHSRLCKRCREQAIRYPLPWIFLPITLVVLALTVFAYFQMPKQLTDYRIYATAEARIQQGMLYDTLSQLEQTAQRHPNSTDLAVRLVTLSMDYGCYDFAAYCMNTHLAGKSLSDTTYGEMIHYQNILNSYYDTLDELQAVSDDLGEDTEQELAVVIIKEKLEDMKGDPKMYQPLVWYYAAQFSEDPEEYKASLLKCLEENPMDFTAMSELGTRLRRDGDFESARSYYEQVLRYEKTEALACRGMAILNLLDGNNEEALTYARTAYESDPDALYVRDTYLITLFENGMMAETEQMKQEMEDAGTPMEDDTKALLSGEISLREYYVEEEAL